jgi:hypothetical protein
MSLTNRWPSPALIVAVVALVAALAGTAIADPGASSSKITKAKVKKVANKQINKRLPIETSELADNAVTAPKLAAINTREATVTVPSAGTTYAEVSVDCQAGEKLISGGARVNNAALNEFVLVTESHKQGNGWYARAFNGFGTNRDLTVEAHCLSA